MDYYKEIKNQLINNEITKKIKDYAKNKSDLTTYFEVGKLLNDAGKHYGEGIIKKYALKLTKELGKGYTYTSLTRIRKYYLFFNSSILAPMAQLLSWSHYVELLPIDDKNEIAYYINICKSHNLSRNQLREKIKNREYQRLDDTTKNKLIKHEQTIVSDFIKNPIMIKNSYPDIDISEKMLKKLILEDIYSFMSELGEGFCFIKDEYKIKIGGKDNFIDLLLFNYIYNCFIIVELKVTELKKEHIGQLQVYMNFVDENVRIIGQDKTIGIIICKYDNKFYIKYSSDDRIYSTTYLLT